MNLFYRLTLNRATAWIVFILSLLMTGLAARGAHQLVHQRAHDRFIFRTESIKSALLDRMNDYQTLLRGGAGLFSASDSVEPNEWHNYCQRLDVHKIYPGIQGLGYAKVISAEALLRHEAQLRADLGTDYAVRPAGVRPVYVPIIYLEPADWHNQRAIGYDMFSEPVRKIAMEQARDSGQIAVSGIVKLVQETDKDVQNGFLMYQPVYRNGSPTETVEQRRLALTGYVYSPFRVGDLMKGVLGNGARQVDFHLYDGATPDPDKKFYEYQPTLNKVDYSAADALFDRTMQLNMAGRIWTIYLHTQPDYLPIAEARVPYVIAISGLLASLLLFLYTRSFATRQQKANRLALKMTAELRDSEQRNRTLVEFAPDAIIVIDEHGLIQDCNPAAERFFGYKVEELTGNNLNMLMPSPHRDAHDGYLARYVSGGEPHIIGVGRDVEALRKDGTRVTIHLRVGEQVQEDGSRRFIGFIRDLSERLQAEALARERRALFHSVIETSADGFWIADMNGRFLEVNDAYCRQSGYSREEMLSMSISDVEDTESVEETRAHIANVMSLGSDLFETRHRNKAGHVWPVEISATHTEESEDRLIVFCRDISARKRDEAELVGHRRHLEEMVAARTHELQDAEQQVRLILDSSADGLFGVDLDGCFTFVNSAACRMLGYTQENLAGKPVHATIHHSYQDGREFPEADCFMDREKRVGHALRVDHDTYWRANGQRLDVMVAIQPMLHDEKIIGSVVSFSDISERLLAEQALRRQGEELRTQYDALEKFNRVMVGREMDMIRMKQQLNLLSVQLGQAKPYDLSFVEQQDGVL
jgi:PAS domain S-box-containing protein